MVLQPVCWQRIEKSSQRRLKEKPADGKSLHLACTYRTPHSCLPISWLERKPSQEMLFRFNNTIAPLLAESYIDESFGASVIFPHVLHQPNVLRVKHDGPCQPLVLSARAT